MAMAMIAAPARRPPACRPPAWPRARSTPARCIRRSARTIPGNCPKCGMALEPLMPSLDEEENPELVSFRHRFWWTLPFTIAVAVLAMFGHRLGWFDMTVQSWVELVLSLPVVLWAGKPFFERGVRIRRQPQPEHVDADQPGHGRGVRLQRRRHDGTRRVSGVVRVDGTGRGLLRSGHRHHLAHPSRPVARAQGAFADVGRDQVAARPGAEDGATHPCRRPRGRRPVDARPRRRPPARATGREGPGRRRRRRRQQRASTSRC